MRHPLSFVHGAAITPLLFQTIGQALDSAVARWGSRPALIVGHQQIRMTWMDLQTQADQLALGLMSLGLQPGERVGIWAPNCAEWVVTQFATAKLGLILVNINPAYRLAELDYALNKVECRALILAERFKSSDYTAMIEHLAPELASAPPGGLRAAKLPHLEMVITLGADARPGFYTYSEIITRGASGDHSALAAWGAELQPDDPINIQFTSGTTGSPKGATLTHFNILNNGYFTARGMNFSEQDRLCIPVPLYHCFGMVMGVLGCVTHGAAMVFPAPSFEPLATLQAIEAETCTALFGVPTMFVAQLEHPDFERFDLTSLRTGVMAGAPCPTQVMNRVISAMHMHQVTIGYGMTETSPISFQSNVDDPLDKRVGTVGRVHPHVQVKIVDENGRCVAIGQQGELLTRGYSVMRGYWNDDAKTAESIDAAGWMHTGDLATLDAQGYCNIVGRVKDMVIRGGENIYPREVEEFLYRHPKVAEVSVFGVPDPKYGEELCAWILLRDGTTAEPEEIRAFCRDQIAHYKIPRYVRFVDRFPMTVTGKIQKFMMREAMKEELGLAEQAAA